MHVSDSLHLALSTLPSRGRPFAWPLALALLTLAQAGCGDKAAAPEANTAKGAAAADLSPAQQVLQRMVARYREAKSYRDQGVVRLKYRQQGQWFEDEGKLTIALVRPNKLQLRAYQLTLVSDGNRLHAVIADPDSNDMDGQVVVRQAPPRFRLDTIYEDPILMDVMSGGMGGPPVTLELLLSDTPLKELLTSSRGFELAAEGTVGDRVCDRVVVIDRGRLVLDGAPDALLAEHGEVTLERLFTRMTGGQELEAKAATFARTFES